MCHGQAYDDYDYDYGDEGGGVSDFSRAQKYSGRLVGVFSSHHHQVSSLRLTLHRQADFVTQCTVCKIAIFARNGVGPNI